MPLRIYEGDCLAVMRDLARAGLRADALVSDAPYHLTSIVQRFGKGALDDDTQTSRRMRDRSDGAARLSRGFMGREWDGGDVAQSVEVWRAAYRLLKPGGFLFAMSATRTQHRMVCAIEDAGFEIRDQIGWIYAQGFVPNKPLRDGENVRLAPAWEPICVARKPLGDRLTVQANLDRYGVGAFRVQDCRVPTDDDLNGGAYSLDSGRGGFGDATGVFGAGRSAGRAFVPPKGRFPKNLIIDGSDVVRELFPDSRGQSGDVRGDEPSSPTKTVYGKFNGRVACRRREESDPSAARFFYCAKATREERAFEHPTVKPVALMRYLVRLAVRPGAIVLDPFAGTGQTGHAALLEGRQAVLIEKEPDYAANLRERFSGRLPRRPV